MPVISQFGGLFPRHSRHLAPENAASQAVNVRLVSGRLEAWRIPLPVGLPPEGTRSFHLWSCCPFHWPACVSATEYLPDYNRLFLVGRSERPEVMTALGCVPSYQFLGVPDPETALLLTATEADGEDCDARSYVYTYMNDFGEESAPSPPSRSVTVRDGARVTVAGFAPPPEGYGIIGLVLYRSVSGFRTGAEKEQIFQTDYLRVAELSVEQIVFADEALTRHLGPALTTRENRPPPARLRGLCHLNGAGVLAGHTDCQVHFSENFEPDNWPSRYDITLPYNIINMGSLDTTLFVTTDGAPFVIDAAPPNPDQERPVRDCDSRHPDIGCGWPRQSVATPFGLVYSTAEGLALLKPDARVDILTAPWYSGTQWRKLRPETVRLAFWRSFLIAATETETLMLNMDGQKFGDYNLGALTTLTIRPTDMCVTENGELIYLENNTLYQWDAGHSRLNYVWESKELDLGSTASPSAARVKTDEGTRFSIMAGERRFDRFVTDETPFRLPRLGRSRRFKVGFYGSGTVEMAEVGYTINTLKQGA